MEKEIKEEEFILIYRHKDTKKYKKFEKIHFVKEKLEEAIKNYNQNDEYDDYVELVQDDFLSDMLNDCDRSIRYKDFLQSIGEHINEIRNATRELEFIMDDLGDLLIEKEED